MEVFDVEVLSERLSCSLPQLLNLQLANLKREFTVSLILFFVCLLRQELRCAITDPVIKTLSEIFTQPTSQGHMIDANQDNSGNTHTNKQTQHSNVCRPSCSSTAAQVAAAIALQQLQFNNCSLTIAV